MVDSKPSSVTEYRRRKPPALLTSRSMWSYSSGSRWAEVRIDASEARSSGRVRTYRNATHIGPVTTFWIRKRLAMNPSTCGIAAYVETTADRRNR
jgi:hypothetical protein